MSSNALAEVAGFMGCVGRGGEKDQRMTVRCVEASPPGWGLCARLGGPQASLRVPARASATANKPTSGVSHTPLVRSRGGGSDVPTGGVSHPVPKGLRCFLSPLSDASSRRSQDANQLFFISLWILCEHCFKLTPDVWKTGLFAMNAQRKPGLMKTNFGPREAPRPPARRSSVHRTDSAPGEEAVVATRPLPRTPEPERRLIPRIRSHRRNKTLPNISLPTNVVHTVHVVFNPVTGDLEGLPETMKALLDASKITKEEKEQNPEAVYQALRESREYPQTLSIDGEAAPPPVPTRPERTKSIYTQPVDNTDSPVYQQPVGRPLSGSDGNVGPVPTKPKSKEAQREEVLGKLRQVVSVGNPQKKYRLEYKIGQGASGAVYTALDLQTGEMVAVKQMILEKQPRQELIINEILVMQKSRHLNIVNYLDSYLVSGELWVIMEYLAGGSLTDVVTETCMEEGHIAAGLQVGSRGVAGWEEGGGEGVWRKVLCS
ncbi:putative serine/threonine-protein kinase PAK 3 isoform X6 [Penaeus vannamei]|uniref:non-specific serine/threonine protein kinase n=1 Tax=Penaeus vannamei TaxID=6689 RepID=A0A3R7QI42_PENVA|nr:putative serine/threonine-protein kinase PAK 3 isoform X6 [Penaeus vannamei]